MATQHLQINPDERLMTGREVAQFLRVHPNTVRKWTKQGKLPCYRINNRGDRRFRRSDLVHIMEKSSVSWV